MRPIGAPVRYGKESGLSGLRRRSGWRVVLRACGRKISIRGIWPCSFGFPGWTHAGARRVSPIRVASVPGLTLLSCLRGGQDCGREGNNKRRSLSHLLASYSDAGNFASPLRSRVLRPTRYLGGALAGVLVSIWCLFQKSHCTESARLDRPWRIRGTVVISVK